MTKFKYPIFNNLIDYSKYYFSSDNKKEEEEESDPNLYLILEYAPNGSLGTYIGKNQIDNTTKQIIQTTWHKIFSIKNAPYFK